MSESLTALLTDLQSSHLIVAMLYFSYPLFAHAYPARACAKGLSNQFCPSVKFVSLSGEKLGLNDFQN